MMPRVFLSESLQIGQTVTLAGEEGHHYARVLRVKPAEPMALATHGEAYLAQVETVDPKQGTVILRVTETLRSHEPKCQVLLIQGLAKGDKMDTILQKGTEAGVTGFLLYESKRSVVRLAPQKAEPKLMRWRKICAEAASQAHRDVVPSVDIAHSVDGVSEWLRSRGTGLVCMLDEDEQAVGLKSLLAREKSNASVPIQWIALAVGPEGGWDDTEREAWKQALTARTVTLGPRILRTETAGLVAVSAVLYEYGELGG